MGDRVSIQFKNGSDKSVVLFSHWGGISFTRLVEDYYRELKLYIKKNGNTDPIGRMEPSTAMVDFIRVATRNMDRVTSDLYLGVDENDGDNSDNGHHVMDLKTGEWE